MQVGWLFPKILVRMRRGINHCSLFPSCCGPVPCLFLHHKHAIDLFLVHHPRQRCISLVQAALPSQRFLSVSFALPQLPPDHALPSRSAWVNRSASGGALSCSSCRRDRNRQDKIRKESSEYASWSSLVREGRILFRSVGMGVISWRGRCASKDIPLRNN
jgi:hypothetical protein